MITVLSYMCETSYVIADCHEVQVRNQIYDIASFEKVYHVLYT